MPQKASQVAISARVHSPREGNLKTLERNYSHFCWICGTSVDLETCKTDELGMAVHADCYVVKVALATESMRLMKRKPVTSRSAAL